MSQFSLKKNKSIEPLIYTKEQALQHPAGTAFVDGDGDLILVTSTEAGQVLLRLDEGVCRVLSTEDYGPYRPARCSIEFNPEEGE